MTKLLDINSIEAAAAWLVEQTGDKDITVSYLVDQCRLGEIKILAATPEWNDIGDGEVHWMERVSATDPRAPTADNALANGDTWISDAPLVSVGSFISGDGLLLVTREMATRLLIHGKSSLSCARIQVIETSMKKREETISLGLLAEADEMITGNQLLGTHDGRMVDFSHLRIRRSALEAFAARQEKTIPKLAHFQQQTIETIEIRKRKALIHDVRDLWPKIEQDLSDSGRNGLRDAAKHTKHGFWRVQAALTWACERGRIGKAPAQSFVTINPDSVLSPMLRHLLKLG